MKDIKIIFGGENGAALDLGNAVENKKVTEQQCLVNLATELGSDPLFPDKGTNLLRTAAAGGVVTAADATHAGNFAALNTLYFVVGQSFASSSSSSGILLANVDLEAISVSGTVLTYTVTLSFTDGTRTDIINTDFLPLE